MIKVGIVGVLGYTGEEIVRYLIRHPEVKITKLMDKAVPVKGVNVGSVFPEFKGKIDIKITPFNIKDVENLDVVFLSLPHTVSKQLAPQISKKARLVIDLSADYRFKDINIYEKWYQTKHDDKENLKKAVYGLAEIMRKDIKGAHFIANPGCYATSIILGLYPLAKEGLLKNAKIIIDAKTGASGAGRIKSEALLSSEVKESIVPYKINKHQHMPEVVHFFKERFKVNMEINFIPQILPIKRGIISMIYVIFKKKPAKDLYKLYKKYYAKERFVRLTKVGEAPQLKDVVKSNFCDIGYLDFLDQETFLVISCIDNLDKGAATQAIQNMNIALGLKESSGLL